MKSMLIVGLCVISLEVMAQKFNGIDSNLSNLFLLSEAKSRSISPENFTGEKGKGGMATEGTGSRASRWWGEGEIKFFMDGDKEFPTLDGTGTEDYFCGSYDWDTRKKNSEGVEIVDYTEYTGPYTGVHQILRGDGHYKIMQRFGMYRWHITDPIRFDKDLKVTIQDLGWRSDGRYLPLQDDIASVVYWYQAEPHNKFPTLLSRDQLDVY